MKDEFLYLLLRESYKQGYLNAKCDIEGGDFDSMDDSLFDDWISEVSADRQVGDIEF